MNLKATTEGVYDAGDFRKSDNLSIGNIRNVRLSEEGQNMMLAKTIKLNVFYHHHVVDIFRKDCGFQNRQGVELISLC